MEEGEIKQTNSNDCLVCYTQKGEKKLCEKCKYLYCQECSVRLNHRCSICLRNTENRRNNHLLPSSSSQEFLFTRNFIPFRYPSSSLLDSYVYPSTESEWRRFFQRQWGGNHVWNEEIREPFPRSHDSSGSLVSQESQDDWEEDEIDLFRYRYWW